MNDKKVRQERIRVLQMSVKRKNITRELSKYINSLSLDSFLSIEKTIELTTGVYEKIDSIYGQETLVKDEQEAVSQLSILKDRFYFSLDKRVALLHYCDRETGAVILTLRDFFENINYILEFTQFKNGLRDLIAVDFDFKFGICIERHEYEDSLIYWDNQSFSQDQ